MSSANRNQTYGFAILIIVTGFVFLLHQMRLLPPRIDDILISWQMLLIGIGIFNIFYAQSRIVGYILIAVGVFFLLPEFFFLPYNFRRNFWPLIIIAIGIIILVKHMGRSKTGSHTFQNGEDGDYIDEANIFSGSEKKIAIKGLKGGKITTIFGGSESDLTGSELAKGENVIALFFIFGGSTTYVPKDWIVINNITPIFGGFSEKGSPDTPANIKYVSKLIIKGIVIFGGGEIKRR
ncbi:MAG: cell wall-active antibiotics response protein [Bacteroidales bacterium]|nr:cell wall-active antibiotics response protein [Bacteroidales bacterium]